MPKPVVAVVGRPNVGKSTLVNRIAVSRDAIVHESRGVTRDRSYHDADWNGRDFTLIDTGGIESAKSKDVFAPRIREQALMACEEADVIVFVVDGTTGVTDEDEEVARVLRRVDKPVFLVVNKRDDPATEQDGLWDFYALGVGEPRPLSAGHGHGTGDLLDDIVAAFPEPTEDEPEDEMLSLAIVGRPNVGKSSLANRLANKKRSIVSDVAGTTRDAIDTVIEWKGQPIKLVDTAGMRKKTQVHEDVEYYSLVRGLQAIDRADVCLLVVDATIGVTEQDQKVAGMAIDRGCGLVLVLNKWDLVETEQQRNDIVASIDKRLAFAPWIPDRERLGPDRARHRQGPRARRPRCGGPCRTAQDHRAQRPSRRGRARAATPARSAGGASRSSTPRRRAPGPPSSPSGATRRTSSTTTSSGSSRTACAPGSTSSARPCDCGSAASQRGAIADG